MHLGWEPGRAIGRVISRDEAIEHEIDAFISKRYEQQARVRKRGGRAVEEARRASERHQEARQQGRCGDQGRMAMCRHLEAVYARRSAEWAGG